MSEISNKLVDDGTGKGPTPSKARKQGRRPHRSCQVRTTDVKVDFVLSGECSNTQQIHSPALNGRKTYESAELGRRGVAQQRQEPAPGSGMRGLEQRGGKRMSQN
jgi:hypothetical protein